jgi:hypothetical protein
MGNSRDVSKLSKYSSRAALEASLARRCSYRNGWSPHFQLVKMRCPLCAYVAVGKALLDSCAEPMAWHMVTVHHVTGPRPQCKIEWLGEADPNPLWSPARWVRPPKG